MCIDKQFSWNWFMLTSKSFHKTVNMPKASSKTVRIGLILSFHCQRKPWEITTDCSQIQNNFISVLRIQVMKVNFEWYNGKNIDVDIMYRMLWKVGNQPLILSNYITCYSKYKRKFTTYWQSWVLSVSIVH